MGNQGFNLIGMAAAALPAVNDDRDDWVFPYKYKCTDYIVDIMSFVEGMIPSQRTLNSPKHISSPTFHF